MEELLAWDARLVERLSASNVLQRRDQRSHSNNPEVRVEIDRERASAFGVSVNQIEEALFTAYGTRRISTIYAPSDQYGVIAELLAAVSAVIQVRSVCCTYAARRKSRAN